MQVSNLAASSQNYSLSDTNSQIASILKLDAHYTRAEDRLSERQLQELLANPQANLGTLESILKLTQNFSSKICAFCDSVARMINRSTESEQNKIYDTIAKDNLELAYRVGFVTCELNKAIQNNWSLGKQHAMASIHTAEHPAGPRILAQNILLGTYDPATSHKYDHPKPVKEKGFQQIMTFTGKGDSSLKQLEESKAYSIISEALNSSLLTLLDSLQILIKIKNHLASVSSAGLLPDSLKSLGGSVVRIMINPKLLPAART